MIIMNKKRNNKGFSLVELIVVIAVMAVLVVVLAPAYLRYVDKAKVQKDVSAVSEVVQSIKIAASELDVADEITEAGIDVVVKDATAITAAGAPELLKEIQATVGDSVTFNSSAMDGKTVTINVSQDDDDYGLVVSVTTDATGDAATALTALK